jgi:hypothetical protein
MEWMDELERSVVFYDKKSRSIGPTTVVNIFIAIQILFLKKT